MMNKIIITLLLIISPFQALAALTAYVDRNNIVEGDIITLTLKLEGVTSAPAPDLSPLSNSFDILGQNQSSNQMYVNGRSSSHVQWTIRIAPKKLGILTIPSLSIKGQSSSPIKINVERDAQQLSTEEKDIYLKAQVDRKEVYVQSQLLYTLSLVRSVNLDRNFEISTPKLDNADVKQLGEGREYENIRNGKRYIVLEFSFAIFPQTSGELIIPQQKFFGTVYTGRSRYGQRKYDTAPAINIKVLPKPTNYPNNTWLPSKEIIVQDQWTNRNFRVGEAATRNISIQAAGLNSSLLPAIHTAQADDFKFYPDQPQYDDKVSHNGLTGISRESIAIIPKRPGKLILPAIELPWWNTDTQQVEYARIAPQTINVLPAAEEFAQPTAPVIATEPTNQTATNTSTTMTETIEVPYTPLWLKILSTGLLLAWLSSLYLWWTTRKQLQRMTNQQQADNPNIKRMLLEKQAFKHLTQVCQKNNPNSCRSAVIQWAQSFWPDNDIHSIQDILRLNRNEPLENSLKHLDQVLYSNSTEQLWNAQIILEQIKQTRSKKNKKPNKQQHLSPLYQS